MRFLTLSLICVVLFGAYGAEPKSAELIWKNGDAISGELVAADRESVTWSSPLFAEPVVIDRKVLQKVYNPKNPTPPAEPYAVVLHDDGSLLYGDVTKFGETEVELLTASGGKIVILREAIQELRSIRGGGVIWAGPYGEVGWEHQDATPIADSVFWNAEEDGTGLQFSALLKPAMLKLGLPLKFEVQLRVNAPVRPEFSAVIAQGKRELRLETWGDTLVLRQGDWFKRVHQLEADVRDLTVRVFYDSIKNSGLVCAANGDIWCRFDHEALGVSQLSEGVQVEGRTPKFTLGSLRVSDWDGTTVSVANASESYAINVDKKERRKPRDPALLPVKLSNTTKFWGRLESADKEFANFRTEFSAEPVQIRVADLRDLSFTAGEVESSDEGNSDQLVSAQGKAQGEWRPGEGKQLMWLLEGAREEALLDSGLGEGMSIKRSLRKSVRRSPGALVHFKSGEVVSAVLDSINDEKGAVTLAGAMFERSEFLQKDLVGAILKPVYAAASGFADPGWRAVGKRDIRRKGAVVTIQKGSGWAHPHILVGNELELTIPNKQSNYPILRLRLFTAGIDPGSPATLVSIGVRGNRVYVSNERPDRRQRMVESATISSGKPVQVRLVWDENELVVHFKDKRVVLKKGTDAPRSGLGLVFETGELWGRGSESPAEVSHVKVAENPEATWAPVLDREVMDRVLTVPRFRRDNPSKHLLFGTNGDVIRGILESVDDGNVSIRSRLRTLAVPREHTAALVWFSESVANDKSGQEEPANAEPIKLEQNGHHWVILRNGTRHHLAVESFGPEFITGNSKLLGKCQLPVEQVYAIYQSAPSPDPATQRLASFRLKPAVEPQIPGSDGGGGHPLVGKAGPEMELPMLNGEEFTLASRAGKVVILDFWATWCAPCVRKMPGLIKMAAEFPKDQVELIGINQGEPQGPVQSFLEGQGWDLAVGMDPTLEIGRSYGVDAYPTTVIIDREGKVRHFLIGGEIEKAMIEALIQEGE